MKFRLVLSLLGLLVCVWSAVGQVPTITTQPYFVDNGTDSYTVVAGQAGFNLFIEAQNPDGSPPNYRWQHNGVSIPDANDSDLDTADQDYAKDVAVGSDAGTYRVLVSNASGSVLSSNVTLTV